MCTTPQFSLNTRALLTLVTKLDNPFHGRLLQRDPRPDFVLEDFDLLGSALACLLVALRKPWENTPYDSACDCSDSGNNGGKNIGIQCQA